MPTASSLVASPKATVTESAGQVFSGATGAAGAVVSGAGAAADPPLRRGRRGGRSLCRLAGFGTLAVGLKMSWRTPRTRRRLPPASSVATDTIGSAASTRWLSAPPGAAAMAAGSGSLASSSGTAASAPTSSRATGHSRRRTSWRQVSVTMLIGGLPWWSRW